MKDEKNYSLLSHNTFGIDVKCARFVEAYTVDDVVSFAKSFDMFANDLLVVGGGSNLLFNGDYAGTVFHSAIRGMEVVSEDACSMLLRVGGGEVWDDVVAYCVANGMYGAENLSAIPGEAGASAVQNIGAYGAEVKDIIYKVEAVEIATGKRVEIMAEDCDYSYRHSRFKDEWKNRFIITHVTYRLQRHYTPRLDYGNIRSELAARGIGSPTAEELRQVIVDIRNAKLPDPKVEGNAGSFFMNPIVERERYNKLVEQYPDMPHYDVDDERVKIPAGWMIDRCGWKGKTVGRAGVHSRQALVLVNRGGAEGKDIVNLCNLVRADVRRTFGIDIHPEVNFIDTAVKTSFNNKKVRLTFLGTGTSCGVPTIGCKCEVCTSSDTRDSRLRCSAMIETDDTRVVIDCTPDFRQQMMRREFRKIDGILVTHSHYDHVGGTDDVRPFCVFGDINIYANEKAVEGMHQMLPYCFAEHLYPGVPKLNLHTIASHQEVTIGNIPVFPITVMHASLPILGYRFGNHLAYITDMKSIAPEEEQYLKGVDTLVVNALRLSEEHQSHILLNEAVEFAKRVGARRTYFIHMSHHIGLHALTCKTLPDGMTLAYDGMVISV